MHTELEFQELGLLEARDPSFWAKTKSVLAAAQREWAEVPGTWDPRSVSAGEKDPWSGRVIAYRSDWRP